MIGRALEQLGVVMLRITRGRIIIQSSVGTEAIIQT